VHDDVEMGDEEVRGVETVEAVVDAGGRERACGGGFDLVEETLE
jgi:hypothetical protein